MGVKISGSYLGNKKVRLVHEPSGAELITSAPVDNQGDGSSFSPTDLVAAALGSCMMTIMGIIASHKEWDLSGMQMSVEKIMTSSTPRRIDQLIVELHLPSHLSEDQRARLEKGAKTCPVDKSLLYEITVTTKFIYDV